MQNVKARGRATKKRPRGPSTKAQHWDREKVFSAVAYTRLQVDWEHGGINRKPLRHGNVRTPFGHEG